MAWTAPRTWITGEVVTAALLNTHLKDNLVDLDRRTSPIQAAVLTVESTTSTSFTDLATAGPAVSVTIGSTGKAVVAIFGALRNTTSDFAIYAFAVSGATTFAAGDTFSLQTATPSFVRNGMVVIQGGLTAGSNTFTAKYRATAGTAEFAGRYLWVTPLGA